MWLNWFRRKREKENNPVELRALDTQLNVVILSDVGNVRTNNEDTGLSYHASDPVLLQTRGYLLLVADGMGGHQAGEVASRLAADTVSTEYFRSAPGMTIEAALRNAFMVANSIIFNKSSSNAEQRGMGTTCSAVVVLGDAIYFGHAGDSRAYHLSQGEISRITTDHTYVQQLLTAGEITQAEAVNHPQRNILTNAMGTKLEMNVDTGRHSGRFALGDRILLCSDGLYEYLSDQEIQGILHNRSIRDAAEYMIAEAKQRGGHDNITVVLAESIPASGRQTNHQTRSVDTVPSMDAMATRDVSLPNTKETDLP